MSRFTQGAAIDRHRSYCRYLPEFKQRTNDNIRAMASMVDMGHALDLEVAPKG